MDYHLNLRILSEMIKLPDTVFGSVKISESDYLVEANKYWPSLGLVTYFSKGFELAIPMGLPGMEYKATDNGTMLYLELQDDFDFVNVTEGQKKQLIALMEQIAERVPGYRLAQPGA